MNDKIFGITISDQRHMSFNTGKNYQIKIPTREEWLDDNVISTDFDLVWYTDGSKTSEGVGAGIYNESVGFSFALGTLLTIFQAEVIAIIECVDKMINENVFGKNIAICSDSLSALKALYSIEIRSKLLLECSMKLRKLGENNLVTLIWVPGHHGIPGNEKADELAKIGVVLR